MSGFSPAAQIERKTRMETKLNGQITAEQRSGGRFFRLMLREVKPEHVPDMIHMLWLFRHGGEKLVVPREGRWLMNMPHEYILIGEGRSGVKIEPSGGQVAPQADNPYAGSILETRQPAGSTPKLDERDTQGVLALCDQARKTRRPQRDQVVTRIFALKLDRCRAKALDAVELLVYELIVNAKELAAEPVVRTE
jgi:hypothetical protein